MAASISIEDFTFRYRGREQPALQHVHAQAEEGTSVVVMGHGGAGKSSLCCALNGLIPGFFRGNFQGRVVVKGREVAHHKVAEMSRVVGLVLQDFEAQLFSTNVELEMAFGPENQCVPRHEMKRRVEQYLAFVGLEKLRRREPASLSGGQKQRLAIGSILAMEPEILVMDEPTTDLDPMGRQEVLSVAGDLRKEGRVLLIVDHEPETAENADQVWLMRDGQIIAKGPPGEVLEDIPSLESCGVKIPPMVELFSSMGWPGKPLTVKEAISLVQKEKWVKPGQFRSKGPSGVDSRGPVVLQAEELGYLYPTHHIEALRKITLSIHEGEFIAFLGQNGSGKTTLAKHFNGLLKPTYGRMLLKGRPTRQYSHQEIARLVGYVFQNPDHQIFSKTVYEEVGFGLKMLGETPKTIEDRVSEVLEVVGLQGYEKNIPFAMTKGERQRLAVASVLAVRPQVVVLDEPTTGLDIRQQRDLMEMLRRLNQKGHTIVIITHSMEVAAEYANRVVVLKDGAILRDGPTRDVFSEEDQLREASLRPPPLVQLSNWLGTKAVTVKQMIEELRA
ncbi:MAG: energy-coupling factor transporter ATPase [Deltaproteobacteria bacterium]